jgi:hypothetical protein
MIASLAAEIAPIRGWRDRAEGHRASLRSPSPSWTASSVVSSD